MIYLKGDVTEAPQTYIAHGCNTLGVMGAGVARVIAEKFPDTYMKYRRFCQMSNPVDLLGHYYLTCEGDQYILNLMTQASVGGHRPVNYAAIATSLWFFIEERLDDITGNLEIAIPKIGAGLGGGDWNVIEQILIDIETKFPFVRFYVYEFEG